jgi:hypothetical protein
MTRVGVHCAMECISNPSPLLTISTPPPRIGCWIPSLTQIQAPKPGALQMHSNLHVQLALFSQVGRRFALHVDGVTKARLVFEIGWKPLFPLI